MHTYKREKAWPQNQIIIIDITTTKIIIYIFPPWYDSATMQYSKKKGVIKEYFFYNDIILPKIWLTWQARMHIQGS